MYISSNVLTTLTILSVLSCLQCARGSFVTLPGKSKTLRISEHYQDKPCYCSTKCDVQNF